MGPPSSGGVHIIQMLKILENYDLNSLGHNSGPYMNLLAEVMKYAYADRSKYLGDPDFYEVPIKKLPVRCTQKIYQKILKLDQERALLKYLQESILIKKVMKRPIFQLQIKKEMLFLQLYT